MFSHITEEFGKYVHSFLGSLLGLSLVSSDGGGMQILIIMSVLFMCFVYLSLGFNLLYKAKRNNKTTNLWIIYFSFICVFIIYAALIASLFFSDWYKDINISDFGLKAGVIFYAFYLISIALVNMYNIGKLASTMKST